VQCAAAAVAELEMGILRNLRNFSDRDHAGFDLFAFEWQ
jgi:hypothetical protein